MESRRPTAGLWIRRPEGHSVAAFSQEPKGHCHQNRPQRQHILRQSMCVATEVKVYTISRKECSLQVGHISYNFDWGTNFISVDFVCDHFFLTKLSKEEPPLK